MEMSPRRFLPHGDTGNHAIRLLGPPRRSPFRGGDRAPSGAEGRWRPVPHEPPTMLQPTQTAAFSTLNRPCGRPPSSSIPKRYGLAVPQFSEPSRKTFASKTSHATTSSRRESTTDDGSPSSSATTGTHRCRPPAGRGEAALADPLVRQTFVAMVTARVPAPPRSGLERAATGFTSTPSPRRRSSTSTATDRREDTDAVGAQALPAESGLAPLSRGGRDLEEFTCSTRHWGGKRH
jgi:hypothetical protein